MTGLPILTAGEMRAAEAEAIAAGTSENALMERAGTAAALALRRFAGPASTLILAGPGNNGGDGYVIARKLAALGMDVRVAASGPPKSKVAIAARRDYGGQVAAIGAAEPMAILVDCLFGTGLARPLDASLSEALARLAAGAKVKVAVDLPSGVSADDGSLISPVPAFDITVTFGAFKPAHLLQPAAALMGRIILNDIGIAATSRTSAIARPRLAAPGPEDHKYRRGMVLVAAGVMPGAAALAADAALRAGAGYVWLAGDAPAAAAAIVRGEAGWRALLGDERVGAVVIGPGLGRDNTTVARLRAALRSKRPLVLDGDALALLKRIGFKALPDDVILTPHEGEFHALFGVTGGSKLERARDAAAQAGAVIIYKGADTVVAAPDGRAAIAAPAPHWLASAGTGDVLAGICGAMRAHGLAPFEAACAAVWLHGRAATLAGPWLIADDLVAALPDAMGECL